MKKTLVFIAALLSLLIASNAHAYDWPFKFKNDSYTGPYKEN